MSAWKWEDLTKRKVEGGVGLHCYKKLMKVCSINLSWNLCTSNSLWSSWMKKKYLHGGFIEEAEAIRTNSGTWKRLMKIKHSALSHIDYIDGECLGEGKNSITNQDIWDSAYPLTNIFPLFDIYWKPSVCPSISMHSIRAIQERLHTLERLKRVKIVDNNLS